WTVPLKNRFFVADINGDWSAHSFGRTEPTEDEGTWPSVLTALAGNCISTGSYHSSPDGLNSIKGLPRGRCKDETEVRPKF
ncbi:unnamed protein product, partial [Larinioides sclopetarius]